MTEPKESADPPLRQISSWKVFGVFCRVGFLFLFGVVFIPWDVQAPDDADLQVMPMKLDADKNAFTYFEAAGRMQVQTFLPVDGVERDVTDLLPTIGSSKEKWDLEFADEVLMANAATFKEIEMGLACESYAAPPIVDLFTKQPWRPKYKQLALLLNLKSKRAQLAGDPQVACQAALQAWRFGQLVTDANDICGWLLGIYCQNTALSRIEEIVADARTPEPGLRDLQVQLEHWNSRGAVRGYCQAMRTEYLWGKCSIELLSHGEKWFGDFHDGFACIPYVMKKNITASMMALFYRNQIENADRPHAKVNLGYSGKPKRPVGIMDNVSMFASPNSVGKAFFLIITPPLNRALSKKCQLQARVAALRLKLALRLYELKHAQLPDDLSALVPEYLKEIPQDPYDGQPVRYSKAEKKLWTVGCDLTDNGCKMENGEEMQDRPGCDLVMPLGTRELKPTPPPPPGSQPKEEPF